MVKIIVSANLVLTPKWLTSSSTMIAKMILILIIKVIMSLKLLNLKFKLFFLRLTSSSMLKNLQNHPMDLSIPCILSVISLLLMEPLFISIILKVVLKLNTWFLNLTSSIPSITNQPIVDIFLDWFILTNLTNPVNLLIVFSITLLSLT